MFAFFQSTLGKYLLVALAIAAVFFSGVYALHELEAKYDKQGYARAQAEYNEKLLKQIVTD